MVLNFVIAEIKRVILNWFGGGWGKQNNEEKNNLKVNSSLRLFKA